MKTSFVVKIIFYMFSFLVAGLANGSPSTSFTEARFNTRDFWSCRSSQSDFFLSPITRDAVVHGYAIEWNSGHDGGTAISTTVLYSQLKENGQKLELESSFNGPRVKLELSDYVPMLDDRIKAGDVIGSAIAKVTVQDENVKDVFENVVCFARLAK
jgi:hypothetical protein